MAQLSHHPSIVTIHQAAIAADGRPYLVMEYCSRPGLAAAVPARARSPCAEALRIGVRLASAVETAHRVGILHRDIKPANVLTTDFGWPALTDFGIAATVGHGAGATVGMSIPWSPPELLAEHPTGDERSDVYSLAATIYSLLAGRTPFEVPGGDEQRAGPGHAHRALAAAAAGPPRRAAGAVRRARARDGQAPVAPLRARAGRGARAAAGRGGPRPARHAARPADDLPRRRPRCAAAGRRGSDDATRLRPIVERRARRAPTWSAVPSRPGCAASPRRRRPAATVLARRAGGRRRDGARRGPRPRPARRAHRVGPRRARAPSSPSRAVDAGRGGSRPDADADAPTSRQAPVSTSRRPRRCRRRTRCSGTRQADGSVVFTWDEPRPEDGRPVPWGVLTATGEPRARDRRRADGDGRPPAGADGRGLHRGVDRARRPSRVGRRPRRGACREVARVRQRATTAAAVVTVPVLVAVLALLNQGFPLARLDLNDGGVWVTATSQLSSDGTTSPVEELNGGLVAQGKHVRRAAGRAATCCWRSPAAFSVVDPATVALDDAGRRARRDVVDGGGHGRARRRRRRRLYVRTIDDLDGLRAGDRRAGRRRWATVAARSSRRSGTVVAVAPQDGAVTRVAMAPGRRRPSESGSLGDGPVDAAHGGRRRARRAARGARSDAARLGRPRGRRTSCSSSRVRRRRACSSPAATRCYEVPLDGGARGRAQDDRAPGSRPRRCRSASCAHAAWAIADRARTCSCATARTPTSATSRTCPAQDVLKFRVNRSMVVLNDTLRGRLWMPLEDTEAAHPQLGRHRDAGRAPTRTQEDRPRAPTRPRTSSPSARPSPRRPRRPTTSSACGRAARRSCRSSTTTRRPTAASSSISAVRARCPSSSAGSSAIYGGRALQVDDRADGDRARRSSRYTITDGRGTIAPADGARAPDGPGRAARTSRRARSAPARCGSSRAARPTTRSLADFVDPDGDDLLLVGATADPAAGSVRFRQDGTMTFKADGASLGPDAA